MYKKLMLVLIAFMAVASNGFAQGQVKEVQRLPIPFSAEDLVLLLSKANGSESRPGIDFDLKEPVTVTEKIQFSFETDDPRVAQLVDQFVADLTRLNRDKQSGLGTQLSPNPVNTQPRASAFGTPPVREFEGGSKSTFGDQKSQNLPTNQDDSRSFQGSGGSPANRDNSLNNAGFGSRGTGSQLPSGNSQIQPSDTWSAHAKSLPQENTDGFRTTGTGTSTYAQVPPQRTAGSSFLVQTPRNQVPDYSPTFTQQEVDRLVEEEIYRRGLAAARAKAESQVPSFGKGLSAEIPGQSPLGQSGLGLTAQDVNRQTAFLWFMLLFSIALNFYLAFLARSFYTRYQDLADELRETFTSST